MFCRQCGAECQDEEKFCPNCGAPLNSDTLPDGKDFSSADEENSTTSSKGGWFQKNKKTVLIIIVVIVAVIVIVSICVLRYSSKQEDLSYEEQMEYGTNYFEDGKDEDAEQDLDGERRGDIYTAEGTPPSVEEAEKLLDQIRYNCAERLYFFYNTGDDFLMDSSEIDADKAFLWVGLARDEPARYTWNGSEESETVSPSTVEKRLYYDGKLYKEGELDSEQERSADYYITFPTTFYQEALNDMFGFDLEDYNLNDMDYIAQDSDGTYYIDERYYRSDTFGLRDVISTIENISSEADNDGNYAVIVKYEGDTTERDVEDRSHEICFMQFRLRPDQNSKYGYVITGMVPAGESMLDKEYLPLTDTRSEVHI